MSEYQSNMDAFKLADLTFHLLANCMAKEEKIATSHGITPAEYRCLRTFEANENINNKLLAKRLNLSPSRLTRIVDALIAKGYLTKRMNLADKRYNYLELSYSGREIVSEVNTAYVKIHHEILETIDTTHHESLINALGHFLTALEKWSAVS